MILITPILIVLLSAFSVVGALQPQKLQEPLRLTVAQSVGMSPLTLRVKARAAAEGREVCIVVDGPEFTSSCRTLQGVTWTMDFELRAGGNYTVFAISENYRTTPVPVRVIGLGEVQ